MPLLTPSPTMLLAAATQLTVTATTERDRLMPRPRLNQRLGTMAATAMDGLHMATATTERGLLMPRLRLSPTMPMATPPTVDMATTERGPLMPRPRLSPTMPMATPPTVDMATTERGLLMPRLRLSPTTSMVPTPPTVTATTERGLLRPRLSPTTTPTPPTVTAITERGLLMLMLRLSPTMPMATPPTAMPTTVKIVQPIIDLITTSNHRACFNINLVTVTYQKMFCSLQ